MRAKLGRHHRERHPEGRHPSQTRTIVADTGRDPDGQNGHDSGAKELEAVGVHDRIADWHIRAGPELGHVEASHGPNWSATRAETLTDSPTKAWMPAGDSPKSGGIRSRINQLLPMRGSLFPQDHVVVGLQRLHQASRTSPPSREASLLAAWLSTS